MGKQHSYKTKGTCSPKINFEIDDQDRVHNVKFFGGCSGNTGGLSALVEGLPVDEVVKRLDGIQCRNGTSCPDQLAKAIKKVKSET